MNKVLAIVFLVAGSLAICNRADAQFPIAEQTHRASQHEVIPAYKPIPQSYEITPHQAFPARACQEPGWCGVVFAQGALKEQIDATPMELRPYRPFHFYGNTVRRLHYRGTALPTVLDIENGTRALFGFPTYLD